MSFDKSAGCLFGLAIGDAIGGTNEFKNGNSCYKFDPATLNYVGGGPFDLRPGEWTDDTSMALALADSIISKQGFDIHDQMDRYVSWYRLGQYCTRQKIFDIGNATRSALERYESYGGQIAFCGDDSVWSSGNGGLMRMAPAAVAYQMRKSSCIVTCKVSSMTTHSSPVCKQSAQLLGMYLFRALKDDASKDDVLCTYDIVVGNSECGVIQTILDDSWKDAERTVSDGYAATTLRFALQCFADTNSFAECVAMAANAGEDSDTNAAVAGQIAGAYYGLSSIPQNLIDDIFWRDVIMDYSNKLWDFSQRKV